MYCYVDGMVGTNVIMFQWAYQINYKINKTVKIDSSTAVMLLADAHGTCETFWSPEHSPLYTEFLFIHFDAVGPFS